MAAVVALQRVRLPDEVVRVVWHLHHQTDSKTAAQSHSLKRTKRRAAVAALLRATALVAASAVPAPRAFAHNAELMGRICVAGPQFRAGVVLDTQPAGVRDALTHHRLTQRCVRVRHWSGADSAASPYSACGFAFRRLPHHIVHTLLALRRSAEAEAAATAVGAAVTTGESSFAALRQVLRVQLSAVMTEFARREVLCRAGDTRTCAVAVDAVYRESTAAEGGDTSAAFGAVKPGAVTAAGPARSFAPIAVAHADFERADVIDGTLLRVFRDQWKAKVETAANVTAATAATADSTSTAPRTTASASSQRARTYERLRVRRVLNVWMPLDDTLCASPLIVAPAGRLALAPYAAVRQNGDRFRAQVVSDLTEPQAAAPPLWVTRFGMGIGDAIVFDATAVPHCALTLELRAADRRRSIEVRVLIIEQAS